MINFIVWLIVGALIGWAASVVMRTNSRQGLIADIIVGIVGAFLAGIFLSPLFNIGTINEGMIHASQVQLADGQTLQVRSETGQPLWSGGATNGQGQGAAAGTADGSHTPEPRVQVDAWITITGTIMAYQGNSMTVAADDGQLITLQSGQPRFFAAQGVTFQVGDEVIIVGFYQGDQFMAGDITQVATGLRVLLRDPNGRPLWAGAGNNGNGNGNGGGGGQNQ